MKQRNGFVSNSSSSCFIIMHKKFKEEKIDKFMQTLVECSAKMINDLDKENIFFDLKKSDYVVRKFDGELFKCVVDNYDRQMKEYKGNLCIVSTRDNSIPYPVFDFIEVMLDARRVHMG